MKPTLPGWNHHEVKCWGRVHLQECISQSQSRARLWPPASVPTGSPVTLCSAPLSGTPLVASPDPSSGSAPLVAGRPGAQGSKRAPGIDFNNVWRSLNKNILKSILKSNFTIHLLFIFCLFCFQKIFLIAKTFKQCLLMWSALFVSEYLHLKVYSEILKWQLSKYYYNGALMSVKNLFSCYLWTKCHMGIVFNCNLAQKEATQ